MGQQQICKNSASLKWTVWEICVHTQMTDKSWCIVKIVLLYSAWLIFFLIICTMIWNGGCEIASSPRKKQTIWWTLESNSRCTIPTSWSRVSPSLPMLICGNVCKFQNLCPCWKTWFAVYSLPLKENKTRLSWYKSNDWCRLYQISKYRPRQ